MKARWKKVSSWLRNYAMVILIPIGVAGAIIAPVWVTTENQEHAREVSCTNIQLNRQQLVALKQISDALGLPTAFTVPEVPSSCESYTYP